MIVGLIMDPIIIVIYRAGPPHTGISILIWPPPSKKCVPA